MPEDAARPESLAAENEEFSADYANNVQFENSAWDLKMIFGQLDQRPGKPLVDYHTAITVPWSQAKIIAYYMLLNIAGYEQTNGKIQIPASVVPPLPTPPTEETRKTSPRADLVYELALELHKNLFE